MDKIEKELRKPRLNRATIPKENYVSTGSTLLNLALSGMPDCGFAKGQFFWFVGDSSSGKTFFTLTCMAEAARNPNFDDYDFIYDDAEEGALMDFTRYFGATMAARVGPPAMKAGEPVNSRLSDEFYFHLDDRLEKVEKGKAPPFIYVLDSMDALDTRYAQKKFKEQKDAARKGNKAKGDYGDGKAKLNSQWIRGIRARLQDTGSILIIISQVRDDLTGRSRGSVSGGRSLQFYASCKIWSSKGAAISKTINGKKRNIGRVINLKTDKNRFTGKEWDVTVPFYNSYGIDDIGACIDFMVAEKAWTSTDSGVITAPEFDLKCNRKKMIAEIEANNWEFDLQDAVRVVWEEIERKCSVDRKSRY